MARCGVAAVEAGDCGGMNTQQSLFPRATPEPVRRLDERDTEAKEQWLQEVWEYCAGPEYCVWPREGQR